MDNTPDWDSLSTSPPQAAPVPQDTSTPDAAASASVDDWANQQLALGVPEAQIEAQMATKLRAAGLQDVRQAPDDAPNWDDLSKTPPKAAKAAPLSWDDLTPTPPSESDITREQQQRAVGYSVPNYTDQIYNSPNADLAKPDAWQAPPTSVGDYLSSLAHAARAQAREWAGGLEQAAGEVPKAIAQATADADSVLSSVASPVQSAPYAYQQAVTQGAPDVNTPNLDAVANVGKRQVAEAQQEQQQAQSNLLPAPDENSGMLDKVKYYAQEAAIGAPSTLAALGAGPVGGAALFGLQSAGGAYAQKRDVEGEGVGTAASSAATEGAISALAASIPLHAALNPESVNALKTVAATTGGGVAQSLLTEAGNMLSEQQNEGKHISYDEAVGRLKAAAAGGVLPGLLLGAAGAAAHPDVAPADMAASRVRDLADQIIGTTPEESDAINAGVAMAKAAEPVPSDVAPKTADRTQDDAVRAQADNAELSPDNLQSAQAKPSDQPKAWTPEMVSAFARDHIAELESSDDVTPADERDLAFLRQNVDNPQAIADYSGVPLSEPSQGTLFARDDTTPADTAPDTSGIEVGDVDSMTPEDQAKLQQMYAEQAQLMADRENSRLAAMSPDDFLHEAMTTLARNNEAFASPRVSPETVSDAVASAKLRATPDSIENEVDLEGNPYTAHNFRLPNGKTFTIKEYPDNWQIDVHKFDPNLGGNKLYSAMTGLAKTTGKPFIGDASGLADWSILRRTENMASNGLKYGVNNVGPHERQLMPGGKMGWAKGLEWTPGNDKANQISLFKTAAENVHRLLPEIDQLRYNPTNDRLEHIDGTPVSADELGELSQRAGENLAARGVRPHTPGAEPDDAQANAGVGADVGSKSGVPSGQGAPTPYGRTSIARAVLTRSILSATGAGDRAAMLAGLRAKLHESSVRRGLFYSRGEPIPESGITPEQAKSEFAKRLSPIEARKLSAKIGMASSADLDKVATELDPAQRAGVRGYTTNGKPHVVLDHVTPDTVVPVAAHEAIHANLQNIIGELGVRRVAGAIRKLAASHPEIQEALDRIPHDTPAEDMDQEVIAHAGEHLFDTSLKTRLLDSVKLGLNRMGFGRKWIDANDSLIRGMTRENLRHYALSDESPSFNVNGTRVGSSEQRTQYAAGDGDSPFAQKLRAAMDQDRAGYTTDKAGEGITRTPTEPVQQAADNKGAPVGVKNAYKAQERQGRGLGELDAEGRRTFGNVWDTASEKLQSDPGYGARLTADVATKSRPLTAEETASLIQYGAGLKNRYEQALHDHDAAIKSGDGTAALGAKIRVKELEDLMDAHDQASRNAGYEQALGLSARRLMANRDYSLATQMMRFRAIEGGEVPQKIQAEVKEYAAKIADLQKQPDEQRARSHVSGYRRPASVAPKQHFQDLRSRFAALAKEQPAGVRFAREDDMRAIVRGMAHSLVEDGETSAQNLVNRIHAALSEFGAQRGDIARTIAGIGERAQHTKTELQLRLAAIKKELRAELANPEAKRNATRQAQLRKQMDDIKRRIATGDFSKATRQPIKYNEDTLGLEDERNKLQRKMDGLAIQRQRANASPSEKLADFIVRLHRGLILTGVNTLGKLSWAALSRIALTPTEELIGSGLRQIPGISQIAAKAPREGAGFSFAAEKAALSHTFDRQQIIGTLLHGEDSLARQYSNKAEYPFDWLNLAGHIHGMIKEPAKLNEFYRGFQQRAQFEYNRVIAEGMTPAQADAHMQKPSTQATLGAQAFIDAKRSIFQNDTQATKLVATIKHMLRTAGADGDAGRALGIAAEKAISFVMPIVKVPVNFAAELGSYAGGGVKAALALRHGIDALTPDQADYVMRNLKKQTVGAALMTVGMLAGPSMFGGFYQTGDARKHRGVKAEEANIPALGGHFNRLWFDSPALDALQVGATLRRIYDQEAMRYGKPSAVGDAIYHAIGGMLEKVPFLDEPKRMFESFGTPKGAQKYLAGAARDTVIPLAVQQYAAHQDNDTARKTKTPLQVFQRGIPQTPLNPQFNREHLPRY